MPPICETTPPIHHGTAITDTPGGALRPESIGITGVMQPGRAEFGCGSFLLDHNILNPIYLSFVRDGGQLAVVEPVPGLKARLERLE